MFNVVRAVARSGVRAAGAQRGVVGTQMPQMPQALRTCGAPLSLRRFASQKPIIDEDLLNKAAAEGEEVKDEFEKTKERKNNTRSTIDKKKDFYSKLFWGGIGLYIVGFGVYLARDWDPESESELYVESEQGFAPGNVVTRFKKRVLGVSDVFNEPAYDVLLPPASPDQYRPPLTLVLELEDLLVHSSWDYRRGWKTAKRPGVDYFLGYLSQYYEIVIFSKSSMAFAETTVAKLDPYHAFISYSLFKEVCRSKDGKLIKDLSLMNRDLAKMVIVDPNPDSYMLQPENAVPIKPWEGKKDTALVDLIPFLEWLATSKQRDVREALATFDKDNIPQEFAQREAHMRAEWEEAQKKKGNDIFSALLGQPALMRKRKMPLDQIRDNGHRNYVHMANYLKEHGEKMLQEEQEKTKQLMAGQNLTLGKIVNEGMPTAEDLAKAAAEQQ